MRILVTGANGLLGQKLVAALRSKQGIELLATGRGPCRIVNQQALHYQPLDVTKADEITSCWQQFRPQAVIHTAAMTNVDACEQDKPGCWQLNADAVALLVAACETYNTHLVHVSTDFVFDGTAGPYSEPDKPNPVSYYGASKLEAERIVQQATCAWAIARTVLVYGVTDNMSRSNVVLWARKALTERQPIRVVNDQFRTPTLAEDLADGCIRIAEQQATGMFHLSGSDFMSVYELVERVGKHFNLPLDTMAATASESLHQPAKRPPVTGFNITKARTQLGYAPHTFEQGLELVARQIAAQGL